MKIIDTHTHIYDEQFDDDIESVIQRAQNAGVEKILLPNIDVESLPRLEKLVDNYPEYCYPMMGLHPTSVDQNWQKNLDVIGEVLSKNPKKYIAVGEIGMDLYWDKTFKIEQHKVFEAQLQWSIDYNLPVSIHTREATSEALESIARVGAHKVRGIFHSFVGREEELKAIMKLDNFFIGINGVVTYKNTNLRAILKNTDLTRIVIETDAPYLTPVPYRGKRNEPAYTAYIVHTLAEVYGVSIAEVGEITTNNALKMFGF